MTAPAVRTRQRILDAATEEFAARGIAGARVDRIAAASGMSKPMLYSHFGAKDRLFDAVFAEHVIANGDRVPFTADDLPGYAARLYDDYLQDPALARLVMWKRLERDGTGYLYPGLEEHDATHVRDIAAAQSAGRIRSDLDPDDVWTLLIATAASWAQVSITTVATDDDAADLHARRRGALAAYVRDGLCAGGATAG
ncbi:TetR/AcrR family transcriptional regulator [Clavibacter capsici]|uniref:TetR/AcrR family transcriptional regulator n=1 Tax=Clavibacter capsici TaxID=1874630 RepID=A0A0M3RRK3_9MICO|nr:TetR family transcriptional regulator [Clavibacter capsici]ALD13465.1 TetR family transcriptional regulator [Clavibacter capsici]QIS39807.1 TetR/AcrR family transcriptional regulator [Clavibacter capsici]QIS42721.1 TetR/AcrR family transcriptional regulator [Clavibacter capsici]QIS45666.1 TetR/AcrR family transcriptional regulator [Clavibacter capsici]